MSYGGTREFGGTTTYGWGTQSTTGFIPGLVVLVAAQSIDVLTTIGGLWLLPGTYEANPIAAAAIDSFGLVTGLFVLGGAVVVCSALLIEASAIKTYRYTRSQAYCGLVRLVGYGSIAFVYLFAGFHNTLLVVEHVSIEWLLIVPL